MQLISQHTKRIMEGCKERAADAGLSFDDATLEYIVTNNDMLELSPKVMIPTMYDYWLQEIQVLKGKGEYEAYPHNPYETVINTRPAISFYNDNNPDWLNVMIFYHVLGHIDFFQNNKFFGKTWDYDFKEKALTEKRIIAKLRAKYGNKLDYVIEFSKGIDNLVGYYSELNSDSEENLMGLSERSDFYFNVFLQDIKKLSSKNILSEIEKYNTYENSEQGDYEFFKTVVSKNPEFEELYKQHREKKATRKNRDLLQFVMEESTFMNKPENLWAKTVMQIVRETSLYFAPQIRTKILNEGWASYWHEKLFMKDDRIKGHEVSFARINAKVTSVSRVGLNPYAIGWRLFMFVEDQVNKGKLTKDFMFMNDIEDRKKYDKKLNTGRDFIFSIRENFTDSIFINRFINQDFVDQYNLMVVGQRINQQKGVKEYYVKSKRADEYKKMINESLYHPPKIAFEKNSNGTLVLNHEFEGKEIYREYIPNTLIGLEYLWGDKVTLETTEIDWESMKRDYEKIAQAGPVDPEQIEPKYSKVRYSVLNKKVQKEKIS